MGGILAGLARLLGLAAGLNLRVILAFVQRAILTILGVDLYFELKRAGTVSTTATAVGQVGAAAGQVATASGQVAGAVGTAAQATQVLGPNTLAIGVVAIIGLVLLQRR